MILQDITDYLDTQVGISIIDYVVETTLDGEDISIIVTAHNGTTLQIDMAPSGVELIREELAMLAAGDETFTIVAETDTLETVTLSIEEWNRLNKTPSN